MRGKKIELKIRAKIREEVRNGAKRKEIMQKYGIAKLTLSNIIREGRSSRRKRGRPTTLSAAGQQKIRHLLKEDPTLSSRNLVEKLQETISTQTMQRKLHQKDFHMKKIKKTQLLNLSHMEKRLQFAEQHVTWPAEKWRNVIFTDKKKFNLIGNDGYVSLWLQNRSTYKIHVEKQL